MLQLGFATRDITPSRPAMIQGQKARRIGHQALDPITVTAWAMSNADGSEATVLVSCDITTPSQRLIDCVRERIALVNLESMAYLLELAGAALWASSRMNMEPP